MRMKELQINVIGRVHNEWGEAMPFQADAINNTPVLDIKPVIAGQ